MIVKQVPRLSERYPEENEEYTNLVLKPSFRWKALKKWHENKRWWRKKGGKSDVKTSWERWWQKRAGTSWKSWWRKRAGNVVWKRHGKDGDKKGRKCGVETSWERWWQKRAGNMTWKRHEKGNEKRLEKWRENVMGKLLSKKGGKYGFVIGKGCDEKGGKDHYRIWSFWFQICPRMAAYRLLCLWATSSEIERFKFRKLKSQWSQVTLSCIQVINRLEHLPTCEICRLCGKS